MKDKKVEQLGMPYGTANNKLKKIILFSLVCKLKENICFKCSKEIETHEELSIEHKEPWLNRDIELFWDLNNIAFSHLKCNRPHDYSNRYRKVRNDNEAWCSNCKNFLDKKLFSPKDDRWNGVYNLCKPCNKNRTRKYRDNL